MADNMINWNKVCKPPAEALKTIAFGRLKGMSDIKPMWRFKVMTEVYGPCGIGWKFEIKNMWVQDVSYDQKFAIVEIELYIKSNETWSDPIPGIGSGKLVSIEKGKLYSNDEAFKMARTDALGSAMQMLGVGAEVYAGNWDGTKYKEPPKKIPSIKETNQTDTPTPEDIERHAKINELSEMLQNKGLKNSVVMDHFGLKKFFDITLDQINEAMEIVNNLN